MHAQYLMERRGRDRCLAVSMFIIGRVSVFRRSFHHHRVAPSHLALIFACSDTRYRGSSRGTFDYFPISFVVEENTLLRNTRRVKPNNERSFCLKVAHEVCLAQVRKSVLANATSKSSTNLKQYIQKTPYILQQIYLYIYYTDNKLKFIPQICI